MPRYAARFVLPLLLLVGCVAVWLVATELGTADVEPTSGETRPSLDTPLASIRRVPEFATTSVQAAAVADTVASLPPDPGGLSCTSVIVDGRPVLEIRVDQALAPAYAQLALTAHAAIDVLGPEYRYETQAMAQALPDENGRVFDGLYLVGGGDPVLMTYGYSIGFRPILSTRTPIEALAADVAAAGVLRIDGGVLAVERRYDTERSLPGWPAEFVSDGLIGPLTALQLDDGFAERAAANGGVAVAAQQPAALAAERFARLLEDLGIEVFGDRRAVDEEEQVPQLVPVARISSPPLAEIVRQVLAVNDAGAAELLVKELGVADASTGSTQAGARVVQQVLQTQGVIVDLPFRDGSGLDLVGGTTCRQLAESIDAVPDEHPTLEVLPPYDLPAVFGGAFGDVELLSDLRLVGGIVGDASGFVARTVDQGRRVTVASIVNRPGGPSVTDLGYQRALVEMVDDLRASLSVEAVTLGE